MMVFMNTGGIATTNAFLVADEETKQAVLFDAPDHTAARLLGEAESRGWEVIGLWESVEVLEEGSFGNEVQRR